MSEYGVASYVALVQSVLTVKDLPSEMVHHYWKL